MANSFFQFKLFTIHQDRCSMKVTTDSCLFGAWVADRIKEEQSIKSILDIGSGTGLLSLMLAQQSATTIDGIELQKNDYLQSLENVTASPWMERINILHADATGYEFYKKYDIIISNPPFYENDLKGASKRKNIAHHDEGLTIKNLIGIISRCLSPKGKFYLLLPEKRKSDLFETAENTGLFMNHIINVHQTENHAVFRIMVEGSFKNLNSTSEEIMIKTGQQYSEKFTALLKDYYLAF